MSWFSKVIKSKMFLLAIAMGAFIMYGTRENHSHNVLLNNEIQNNNILHQNTTKDYTSKDEPLDYSKVSKNNQVIQNDAKFFAHAMMKEDEGFRKALAENVYSESRYKFASNNNYDDVMLVKEKSIMKDNPSAQTMATVMEMDRQRYKDSRGIKTNKIINDTNIMPIENEIAMNTTDTVETNNDVKDNIEANEKVNDTNTVYPGYMTGSAIPSTDNNASTRTSIVTGSNYIVRNNNVSPFPDASREAEHDCFFDTNAQMQCRKSITICVENAEEGLACTVSYFLKGIWHSVPTHLTIENNASLIQKHLQTRTTFAIPKFSNHYYINRYAYTNLIRPDIHASKNLHLIQVDKNTTNMTVLDHGLLRLLENDNSKVSTSIFLRGTRFGMGHEKIKGGNSELLEGLKEFFLNFTYIENSDAYENVKYWTPLDANHTTGNSEDFALTGMEWLLLSGVDPKYITLVELKTTRSNISEIVLILKTEEPSETWVVRGTDIRGVEEIYPEGYKTFILNAYKYKDRL